MGGRGRGGGKVLLPPINAIFQLLQRQQKVSIWLYEQLGMRIEGTIKVATPMRAFEDDTSDGLKQGFDEFMNLVIEDAVEVRQPTKTNPGEQRKNLGERSQSQVLSGKWLITFQDGYCSRATMFH